MMTIGFKGTIRDFYNLLTAPQTVSKTHAQVTKAQSCANHVQHIARLPRATCRPPQERELREPLPMFLRSGHTTCNTSRAYHVQRVARLRSGSSGNRSPGFSGRVTPRATHRATTTCNMSSGSFWDRSPGFSGRVILQPLKHCYFSDHRARRFVLQGQRQDGLARGQYTVTVRGNKLDLRRVV